MITNTAKIANDHRGYAGIESNALIAFDRLSIPLAQDLMQNWQRDPSYLLGKQNETAAEA